MTRNLPPKMPAQAKQAKEAKEPALSRIDPARLPELLSPAHTGKLARGDARLVRAVKDSIIAGMPMKSISAIHHIDFATVVALKSILEQSAELPPHKQRIQAGFAQLLEEGTEQTLESIRSGKKKLTCYDLGVLYDRHSHMMGEPSLRVDVEVHGPRLDELTKLLTGPVVDVESSVGPAQVNTTDVVGHNSGQGLPSVSGQAGGRGVETAGGHEDGDGI